MDLKSACTSLLVGRKMTTDGSFIAARSEDWDSKFSKHFEIHQPTEKGPKEFIALDSPFRCELPEKAFGYTALAPYHLPNHWGSAGFNSEGVGMSSTETIFSSKKAIAADPLVPTGLAENCIFNVTIPYIKTAREGVKRLGSLIEKYGSAEGYGISFVDDHELWYLETAAGHRWLATRIPEDVYFASGNQSRFRKYDPTDEDNYLASPDLIEFAIKNNLYNPDDGEFDFHKAYSKEEENDKTYNYPRVWYMQSLLSPEIKNNVAVNNFPVFAKANKKLSVEEVKTIFRTHYNGTQHDPYLHNNPKEPYRPISIFRTTQIHILQVRPELPMAIGRINYVALGMASLGMFLPYYHGIKSLPETYRKGTDRFSDDSVYWRYKKVQTLAMVNYNLYAPVVLEAFGKFEKEISQRQREMEIDYMSIYKDQPLKAADLIQNFTDKMIADAEVLVSGLINELFTQLARNTQDTYLFHGA